MGGVEVAGDHGRVEHERGDHGRVEHGRAAPVRVAVEVLLAVGGGRVKRGGARWAAGGERWSREARLLWRDLVKILGKKRAAQGGPTCKCSAILLWRTIQKICHRKLGFCGASSKGHGARYAVTGTGRSHLADMQRDS